MDVWSSHRCACGVDTWFPWMTYEMPMDDVLMKKKAHKARGSKLDLLMTHREVLKFIERS